MEFLVATFAMATQVADGFADGPQLCVVRVCLETPLVGKRQHLVVHSAGVADTQHIDAPIHQFFTNPIDSHITLCTYQHLVFAHQRLADGLYQCRRLARSRGTMYDSHILGSQHHVDGLLLRSVQIGKVHGWEDEGLWLLS